MGSSWWPFYADTLFDYGFFHCKTPKQNETTLLEKNSLSPTDSNWSGSLRSRPLNFVKYGFYRLVVEATHSVPLFCLLVAMILKVLSTLFACDRTITYAAGEVTSELMIKTAVILIIQIKEIKTCFFKHSQESLTSLMTGLQMPWSTILYTYAVIWTFDVWYCKCIHLVKSGWRWCQLCRNVGYTVLNCQQVGTWVALYLLWGDLMTCCRCHADSAPNPQQWWAH